MSGSISNQIYNTRRKLDYYHDQIENHESLIEHYGLSEDSIMLKFCQDKLSDLHKSRVHLEGVLKSLEEEQMFEDLQTKNKETNVSIPARTNHPNAERNQG